MISRSFENASHICDTRQRWSRVRYSSAMPAATEVGDTELAQRFYAGKYADIIATTYDHNGEHDPADLAFVIGALTFVDRVDEAHALFDANVGDARPSDPRTVAASRFFLGLAHARAGYFAKSFAFLVTRAFSDRYHPDPWVRAFVFQGLACQCYFTGRYPGAARHALRALQAAHEAKFLYAAMLGTDMRGHALVQIGQLQRGIAMLEQATKQARRLGLTNNEFAVETSIATYVTRFIPHAESLERVEALLRRRAHDSYSRRALLSEAAVQRALRGRRSDALQVLEESDRDALRGDTRRGKVVSFLARLWVTRWQRGPEACADLVEQAAALVEPRDVAFRSELLGFSILVARTRNDAGAENEALAQLRELWRTSHHFTAKAALNQFDPSIRASAFDEDGVAPLLRAVAQRDGSALSRMLSLGLLGAIPELLGLTPGKRIILIPAEDVLILEDHGDVIARQRPPRWCPVVLRILASGNATKQHIVEGLWGLRAYHPEIHDPPVRTTIHRLRSFLQPYRNWIEVDESGYRVTVPIHVIAGAAVPDTTAPLWEEGEVPSLEPSAGSPGGQQGIRHAWQRRGTQQSRPGNPDWDRPLRPHQLVYQRLAELDGASVSELARTLELSASTVLRALRHLVHQRRVERLGFARATRYRARPEM